MSNKKITELPEFQITEGIQEMAAMDHSNIIHRVNIGKFDCTSYTDAMERVKKSIKEYGHVLIIPFKPL